jgi:hypothetical protein
LNAVELAARARGDTVLEKEGCRVQENEEDLKQQIADLKAELATEKSERKKGIYLQVSKKGGVSLYGIRRFPITFYLEEWNRILDMDGEIRAFLAEHVGELTKKS